METLLKKPEIKRDAEGRFEQHGKELAKTAKNKMKAEKGSGTHLWGKGQSGNPAGRKKGTPNRVTTALKDMILGALDKVGGEDYLATLAIENSSAFAGLVGKVLPTTLSTSESNGGPAVIRFERVIVMPDGTKHIEGVTPKALPAPERKIMSDEYYEELKREGADPHTLPTDDDPDKGPINSNDL